MEIFQNDLSIYSNTTFWKEVNAAVSQQINETKANKSVWIEISLKKLYHQRSTNLETALTCKLCMNMKTTIPPQETIY